MQQRRAPTPRPTANRLRIGRSSAAYWALIGRLLAVKAHASALRTSRSRSRTRSCWATSRSRTIMFSPVSPDGPPRALTRWCVARGGGAARCAWRRRRSGARARGAPAPAAPERRRADPRRRCCMNTLWGWESLARTSRDPPQEPHYRDEVEGPFHVQDEVPRCELAGL